VLRRFGLQINSLAFAAALLGFLMLPLSLAAQGGAAEARGPSSSSDIPADHDSRPLIVCFGDSLTAGYGLDPSASYPADLQRRLDAAGYHYRVVNEGVSGDTTKDGLERVRQVLARNPYLVVVEFGGNDGLRGLPVEHTRQTLAAMIQQIKQSGARVALAGISLPPQYGNDYIAQFDAMYPTLAHQFRVPLLPFILQNVYGIPGDIQPDGVHPTAVGAKQVAVNVQKLIQPMLKK
jgi:acyl-CoA thioesterase-1